jgi:hypothetical protein
MAFAISAALFGLGTAATIVLLPSRQRLQELRKAAAAPALAPLPARRTRFPARRYPMT